jgi:hypothetical protein
MKGMENIVLILYAFLPILTSVAHGPQLKKAMQSTPEELQGLSLFSYWVWFSFSVISLLYGFVHLKDTYFIIVSSAGVFWNTAMISVLIYKRQKDKLLCVREVEYE